MCGTIAWQTFTENKTTDQYKGGLNMKIILDGMGGDNAPSEIVKGAVEAARHIEHQIILVGDEERIRTELSGYTYDPQQIGIRHAADVITNDDAPVKAVRTKTESSMVVPGKASGSIYLTIIRASPALPSGK